MMAELSQNSQYYSASLHNHPDRFHIKVSTGSEMLVVSDKGYKMLNGSWTSFPIDIGSIVCGLMGGISGDPSKTIIDGQYVGQGSVNGASAQV